MKRMVWLAGLLAFMLPACARAQAPPTPVKFALDWVVIGTHLPYSAALASGFFKDNGLDVTIDRGYGSGDTISKVGNRLYDFGYADANLVMKWNHDNPDQPVVLVYLTYDGGQSSITVRRSAATEPKQLQGRLIGAPPGDNTRLLFPVYARAAGFDPAKVRWASAQPNIENTMLFRGDVDGLASQEPSTMLALEKLGANTNDYIGLRYSVYLPELLGSGIVTNARMVAEHPDVVRAFVRAVIAGQKQVIADPAKYAQTLKLLSPLADPEQELRRYRMGMEMAMSRPELGREGLGTVDAARLRKVAEDLSQAFAIPVPDDLQKSLYDQRFLPPLADRQF